MKTLVYTTTFGEDHFFRLAEEMLRSLRHRGYDGDAVVISERPHAFLPELDARNLVLSNPSEPVLLKAALPQLMDISGYDRILFVDTDVAFLKEPSSLFALAGERMAVSREHFPLHRHGFNLSFIPPADRKSAGFSDAPAVNTGVIVFPGNRHREYAEKWLAAWRAPDVQKKMGKLPLKQAQLREQPMMQLLVTGERVDYEYVPDDLLLMPWLSTENQPLHPDAVLLHFNGTSRGAKEKNRTLEVMSELRACNAYEEFKAVCDRLQNGRKRATFPSLP